jgi:hypothetical protein
MGIWIGADMIYPRQQILASCARGSPCRTMAALTRQRSWLPYPDIYIAVIMRIAFGLVIWAITSSAMACQWKERSTEQIFSEAQSVFRARVIEVKLVTPRPDVFADAPKALQVVEARYDVLEKFKGEPPSSGVVRDFTFAPGNCSLGLMPGWEYIFVPGQRDMVLLGSGSFGYFNPDAERVKPRIDEFRKLSQGK